MKITSKSLQTLALTLVLASLATAVEAQTALSYFPLNPCRAVDTRNPVATNGGPIFAAASTRNFAIRGTCGVPVSAKAVSINVTITGATQSSFLTLWPSGGTKPVVSTINFESADPALANGAIIGLSALAQDLSVYNDFGQVHVILDVTGYFQ